MYIQPNMLLTPTEKLIKPYQCSFIVIEGPTLKGKLSLEGLEIRYDSFYLSQLILNPSAQDQPLLYGFLGNDVTFLMVKAKYVPTDPNWAVETDQYIEYYFEDDTTQVRSMGQLLILTGNSTNRIPQIYFNNPNTTYSVYLEVLMANLPQSSLVATQYTQDSTFSGLYYNSIISDTVYYTSPATTGSTELMVIDIEDNVDIIIPYTNIRTITKTDTTTLLIGLDTDEKVKLEFLSAFNCDQANSRIHWVLESQTTRTLTKVLPEIDITPPVFSWNDVISGTTTGLTSGSTTVYLLPSGTTSSITYTSTILKETFLSGITDAVDGTKSIYDASVLIYEFNGLVSITGITSSGICNAIFTVKDIATNSVSSQKFIGIYSSEIGGYYLTGYWDGSTWTEIYIEGS